MAGLEWSRGKWGRVARAILKHNESSAVRYANTLIADNQGLVDYVKTEYGKESICIAYGGDQFLTVTPDLRIFNEYSLPMKFDFSMARAQIDNNMEMILRAYSNSGLPLVFISNWESCAYGKKIRKKYAHYKNIHLIGPIYDIAKIKAIHRRARMYIHGHSAGGTNPVLVESMWARLPIACFDINFHRHTTNNLAFYFKNSEELENISMSVSKHSMDLCAGEMFNLANHSYSWNTIRSAYENVIGEGALK
jgi:glycosyltransferase involved in cell wall biosynthesis